MRYLIKSTIILCLMVFTGLTACTKKPEPPLVVGSINWLGYQPLFLSQDLGFIEKKEISVLKLGSASEVIRGFRNKIIDAATLTLDETISLAQTETDFEIILVMDISHGADAIVARPPITRLSELKSKTIGIEKTALGAYMLTRALQLSNLSENDIKIISVEFDQHKDAFLGESVDAIVTFDPVKTLLQKHGGNIVFDSSHIPGEIIDVLIVRRSLSDEKKQKLQQVVNTWFKTLRYINENHEIADPKLAELNQLSLNQYRKARRQIRLPDREKNLRIFQGKKTGLTKQIRKLKVVMKKYQESGRKFSSPKLNPHYINTSK